MPNNNNNSNNSSSIPPRYPDHNVHDSEHSKTRRSLEEIDQAEQGLIESVEARRSNFQPTNGEEWQSAVDGERPPLHNVPFDRLYGALNKHPYATTQEDTDGGPPPAVPPPAVPPPNATTTPIHRHQSSSNNLSVDAPPSIPPRPPRLGETGSHRSASSTTRGSRSRGSKASLLSRGRTSRSVMAQPNYTEIVQNLRRRTTSTNNTNTNATTATGNASVVAPSSMADSVAGGGGGGGGGGSQKSSEGQPETVAASNAGPSQAGTHRRHASKAHALLEAIQEKPSYSHTLSNVANNGGGGGGGGGNGNMDDTAKPRSQSIFDTMGTSGGAGENSNTDQLITGAMQIERLFQSEHDLLGEHEAAMKEEEEAERYPEVHDEHNSQLEPFAGDPNSLPGLAENAELQQDETLPLLQRHSSFITQQQQQQQQHQSTSNNNNITRPTTIPEDRREALKQRRKSISQWQLWKRRIRGCCCDPRGLLDFFYELVLSSYSFKMSVPLTIMAWIFFYKLGDPSPEFLPGQASISWWLLFIARQCVTLDLAHVLQWIVVDCVILSSRTAVRLLGPLLTLVAIQAKGWPFCSLGWATVDLFALHGTQNFQQHWLYWTGIGMYEYGNTGLYVLNAPIYTRGLLAAIVAGIATAAKRTVVALYFGRRTFAEFKPRLEKILREVIVLSEVAELAMEAEILEASSQNAVEPPPERRDPRRDERNSSKRGALLAPTVHWSPALNASGRNRVFSQGREGDGPDGNGDDSDGSGSNGSDDDDNDNSIDGNRHATSGNLEMIYLLEHWEEPKNAMDKSSNASINDILKFRRALAFMDDAQPFGGAFGPGHNREAVIRSAEFVFRRLLTLSPGNDTLPFEALEMLAHEGDVDGPLDRGKLKTIKRMFRPDKDNSLSLLDFVKACDGLYKRLRFFRASVGNASVIDHHLESIIDFVFYFVLLLMILSMTGLNPWPLLVSISTLLVSISFAVGSSASKYIEGILLIAVRRPYDLGDRIYMMNPSLINSDDGIMVSWFIEDINLFSTTIRYAATNETATINNGSICNLRITNANRSQNANVWFQLPYRTKILREGRMEALREMLEQYAKDHPEQWHSFSYARIDEVHGENDKLVMTIGFQHRSSWQDLVSILTAKAELVCHVLDYGKKHRINWEDMPTRNLMYYAGRLQEGGYAEHRDSLTESHNIINDEPADLGLRQRRTRQASSESNRTEADDLFLTHVQRSHNH